MIATQEARDIFTHIYRTNFWGGSESRSGQGSGLAQTVGIRRELPKLIERLGVKSVLDAGCGDFHWMSKIDLGASYTGVDIVADCIKHDQHYENEGRKFICADVVLDDLPRADLIICRDVLVHLSYEECLHAISNFKRSGAKYLLTTTFLAHDNRDLLHDLIWRPLNLCKAPFNFPAPLELIAEEWIEATSSAFDDYRLGLWRLDDLMEVS